MSTRPYAPVSRVCKRHKLQLRGDKKSTTTGSHWRDRSRLVFQVCRCVPWTTAELGNICWCSSQATTECIERETFRGEHRHITCKLKAGRPRLCVAPASFVLQQQRLHVPRPASCADLLEPLPWHEPPPAHQATAQSNRSNSTAQHSTTRGNPNATQAVLSSYNFTALA
jgi:hypothetical protein